MGFLDGLQSAAEEIGAKVFETSASDGSVEINAFEQGIDLDGGLGGGGESSLGSLAGGPPPSQSAFVGLKILLVLPFELLGEVVDHAVVEILTSQVSVTGSGFDFEDAVFDGENRDIESAAAQIEDEDVALLADFLVQTVGDGCGCGLVDDTQHVHASDSSGIFGGLTLRVVEVSGDCDDGVGYGIAQISFRGFLHLGQDHGGNFFGIKGLVLVLVLDLDLGLAAPATVLPKYPSA